MEGVRISNANRIFALAITEEMTRLVDESMLELPLHPLDGTKLDGFSEQRSLKVTKGQGQDNVIVFYSRGYNSSEYYRIDFCDSSSGPLQAAFIGADGNDQFEIPAYTYRIDIFSNSEGNIEVHWDTVSKSPISDENEHLRTENERLLAENERLHMGNDFPNTEIERLRAENESLKGENDHLCAENERLHTENEHLRIGAESPSAESEYLRAENERLLEDYRNMSSLVARLQGKSDREIDQQSLIAQLEELAMQINEVTAQNEKLKNEYLEKEQSLGRLNRNLSETTVAIQTVNDQIEIAMNQDHDLDEQLRKANEKLLEDTTSNDSKRRELKKKLKELGMDEDTLRFYETDPSVEELIKQIEELRAKVNARLVKLLSEKQKVVIDQTNAVTTWR